MVLRAPCCCSPHGTAAWGGGGIPSLWVFKERVDVAPRAVGSAGGRWVVGLNDLGGLFQP